MAQTMQGPARDETPEGTAQALLQSYFEGEAVFLSDEQFYDDEQSLTDELFRSLVKEARRITPKEAHDLLWSYFQEEYHRPVDQRFARLLEVGGELTPEEARSILGTYFEDRNYDLTDDEFIYLEKKATRFTPEQAHESLWRYVEDGEYYPGNKRFDRLLAIGGNLAPEEAREHSPADFEWYGPDDRLFRYLKFKGGFLEPKEAHARLPACLERHGPHDPRFLFLEKLGGPMRPKHAHARLRAYLDRYGPNDPRFLYLVRTGKDFTPVEAQSMFRSYFERFGPRDPRFQHLEKIVGFTKQEIRARFVNSFRGPLYFFDSHHYLVEKGGRFEDAEASALIPYFLRQEGSGSQRYKHLVDQLGDRKPLLATYLTADDRSTRWDILFPHFQRTSPVLLVHTKDGSFFRGSQAMFQAQSRYFHRQLDPSSGYTFESFNPWEWPIPSGNECLDVAVQRMRVEGMQIPLLTLDHLDQFTASIVLTFCQMADVNLEFATLAERDRLECWLMILEASTEYEIFLLERMVQTQIITEIQGANHEDVKRIKERAPRTAAILIEWCSERLLEHSKDVQNKSIVLR